MLTLLNKVQMAILDNFEVDILTINQSRPGPGNALETTWAQVREHEPPGVDTLKSSFNTCRKYIGIPPIRMLDANDRVNTEFVIDYKVKCGFSFADQNDTGVEYIVFRTYLDGEKIGSASVKRSRWERSGTYRIRKQGKRYRVENDHRWIRQRWMFDPGLHGTIKVEVWRERTKIPVVSDWDFIDLTMDDNLVVGQEDLPTIVYEPNAKRPRVRHLVKLDLLPIATFEFEYRSEETLRILGVTETEAEISNLQRETDEVFTEENNDLWRTMTGTSSSGGTVDTMMDTLLNDMDPQSENIEIPYGTRPTLLPLTPPIAYTDAIGRNLLTGMGVSHDTMMPAMRCGDPSMDLPEERERSNALPAVENAWWVENNAPVNMEIPPKRERIAVVDLVDLTMLD